MKKKIIILLTIICTLNIAACFREFCDLYRKYVYKFIANVYGRVMNIFPFAMGEIIMYIGFLMLFATIILSILLIFLRKKEKYKSFTLKYLKIVLMTVIIMMLIYTLNWIIPFRASGFMDNEGEERTYSVEKLQTLRNYIVGEINILVSEVERDDEGHIIYGDTQADVIKAMQKLGETYPVLDGYYPRAKEAVCSDYLDWMYIGGFTYPYTMEVTINKYNSPLYLPALIAHEMAHHKGYYQENEANFISYLACSQSDNKLLQYSAYLDIYYYVENAYVTTISEHNEAWTDIYKSQIRLEQQVLTDIEYASDIAKEVYEEEAHAPEALMQVTEDVADKGWDIQADILQENCYDGVVLMLLEYYEGILY